jgi:hypothetical protein
MRRGSLRIVVAASIASVPGQGGWTWAVLQYVVGLRRLGHRVTLVDPLPATALQPGDVPLGDSANAAYFRACIREFELEGAAALVVTDGSRQTVGPMYEDVVRAIRRSDLLINVSGVLRDPALRDRARRRVYLDLDPAFTQLWHAVQGIDMGFAEHTDFATIGLAIGEAGCPVPPCGIQWVRTPQPIVLDRWPAVNGCDRAAPLTTVANWRGYGSIEYKGVLYGQKAHAWRELMPLPTRTPERFVVALAIHRDEGADLQALEANRWTVVAPSLVTATPAAFQQFVQRSKGELGVAKTGYVASRCGWFSDRSICYLASGRPVLAQETGFSRFLPTGEGIIAFEDLDQALATIEQLNARYAVHARAARAIAETFFDSDRVLPALLERLGVTA